MAQPIQRSYLRELFSKCRNIDITVDAAAHQVANYIINNYDLKDDTKKVCNHSITPVYNNDGYIDGGICTKCGEEY